MAANISSSRREAHVPGDLLVEAEQHAAERRPGAPPSIHTSRMTRFVLMPVADARSGLSRHGADRLAEAGALQEQRHADAGPRRTTTMMLISIRGGDRIGPMSIGLLHGYCR